MNRLFRTALGTLALASSLACACSPETIEEPKQEDPLIIEVSRTEVPLTCDGGIVYVTVSAPAEVSAVSDAEWCEAEILADREQNNLRLTVEPAQEEEAREAVVTLSSEGCDDVTVTVSQEGREIPKSTECDLLTFSIPAEANGLDSPIEFDFDEQTRTLDAMYLKWIEKDSPEMLIPEFTMTGVKAYADGVEIVSGETPVSFAEDVHLTVEAESGDVKEYVVTLNCPQINVELPVLRLQPEREIVDKENYVDTKVTLYSPFTDSGWWNPDDEPVEVRGRGNSTWGLPKKPYRLKFPDKVSPIGLNHTEAKSWVILAHDMDKSLLRNHLAFEVSKIMYNPSEGWHDPSAILFTPCSQFVNVYMNDDYHGIYQMSDQMEQREGRIAVEELTDKDGADPEKITGGYIIETDIHEGNRYTAYKNIRMTYKYPDDEEYDPAQYQYISDFIDNAESVLYSSDFKDPETGWRRWFDEKTLVDFVIIKEFCGDLDGYTSVYMYKRRGVDKLFFGPIWDVDKGWDNDKRAPHGPQYMPLESLMIYAGFYMPSYVEYDWFQRLWEDESFRESVATRWDMVRDRLVAKVNEVLATQPVAMKKAIEANFEVWPFYYQASDEANMPAPTYEEELERISRLTDQRAALLDRLFNESPSR